MIEKEIDSFLEVDEHDLDSEWVKQPSLYMRWARRAANTRRKMDEAKAELDVIDAELGLAIRNDPESYDLSKVTEAGIAGAIVRQQQHKDGLRAVHNARHNNDVAQAVLTALDHRKKALENLVSLHLASYYSEPRAPKGRREETEEMTKRQVRRRRRKNDDD